MHLTNLIEVCDTNKYNGVTEEALRLRLFLLSLGDRAKHWLTSQPPDSITSWNDLVQKFLTKFFPHGKIAQLVQEINTFRQLEGESLAEAWDRFHELLRKCPHHRLTRWMQVHTFYNGLRNATRTVIDASAGGVMSSKVIHFQSIFLIDFYLKRLIYVQKYGITNQTAMQQGIKKKKRFLQ